MLVNIFGKRGAGKTHMIKQAIQSCIAPVVIIDILGNFTEEEIPGSYESDSLSDILQKIKDFKAYEAATKTERGLMEEIAPVLILHPVDPDEAIDFISAMLWEVQDSTLVIDEADAFSEAASPCFSQLIRYGRNHGVHLLTGCRRPAELSRNITAGANCIYIFQTQEPRDIEYFSKTLIGKVQAERLKNLPEYHGLFINYDKKTTGVYKTDELGRVFILNENKINSQ